MAMYPITPVTVVNAATALQRSDGWLESALAEIRDSLQEESDRDVNRRHRIWARIAAAVDEQETATLPAAFR